MGLRFEGLGTGTESLQVRESSPKCVQTVIVLAKLNGLYPMRRSNDPGPRKGDWLIAKRWRYGLGLIYSRLK